MRRVFVCSPYRGDVARNVETARLACRYAMSCLDGAPFAPHLVYPSILDDENPRDRELGMKAGMQWLRSADLVLVVRDGPEPSEGMRAEIALANFARIPLWTVTAEELRGANLEPPRSTLF